MASGKKSLDVELNLIGFISLLSVMICSLLLTAVWVQVGSMNVKQAIGGQSASAEKVPTIWARINAKSDISFELQDVPKAARSLVRKQIQGLNDKINRNEINAYLGAVREKVPGIRTALIQPRQDTVYEEIIALMDEFRKQEMVDLGISPL